MGFNLRRPLRKKDNPEGRIQLQILHYLKRIGAVVGKTKIQGTYDAMTKCRRFDIYNMRGKADLECFYKGVMYCLEIKAPGKSIEKDSDQDNYRKVFHKPPHRIFIEADCLEDVLEIIK